MPAYQQISHYRSMPSVADDLHNILVTFSAEPSGSQKPQRHQREIARPPHV
jgi:hypothetical protein